MENIKLEHSESSISEDFVERPPPAPVYVGEPSSSTLEWIKSEDDNTCDFDVPELCYVNYENQKSNEHNEDNKSFMEEFINAKEATCKREDITNAESENSLLHSNVKLEWDDISEESCFDETKSVTKDIKPSTEQLIEDEEIYKTEVDTLSENCGEWKQHEKPHGTTGRSKFNSHIVKVTRKTHKCFICDYTAVKKSDLQRHMNRVHLKMRNHKCKMCDFVAFQNYILQSHIDSVHLGMKNYKCDMCDYTAVQKSDLQRHMNRVHLKVRKNKCHMCDFTAALKLDLKRHVDGVHLKVKNQKCDMCDYTTTRKGSLQTHIDIVHLKMKNHKCTMCDYTAALKHQIQRHISSVHVNEKNHKCNICDYKAALKQTLKRHIDRVHWYVTDAKLFEME